MVSNCMIGTIKRAQGFAGHLHNLRAVSFCATIMFSLTLLKTLGIFDSRSHKYDNWTIHIISSLQGELTLAKGQEMLLSTLRNLSEIPNSSPTALWNMPNNSRLYTWGYEARRYEMNKSTSLVICLNTTNVEELLQPCQYLQAFGSDIW